VLAQLGERDAAIRSFSRVVELEPNHPQAWRELADLLVQADDTAGAANAYARQIASSVMDLTTLEQVAALDADKAEIAHDLLHEYLNIQPTDLNALETLGALHFRTGEFEAAEEVFKRALDLAPSFLRARLGYLSALQQQRKSSEEIRELDVLLADDPENAEYRELRALALSATGQVQESVDYCEDLVRSEPNRAKSWLTYAHVLRVAGRQEDCIHAYRKAIALDPPLYEAWWGLANLRTFRFAPAELSFLESGAGTENMSDASREFRHFTLGKALEDQGRYRDAFEQYSLGNALIRAGHPLNIADMMEGVQRQKRRYTRAFFERHAKDGAPAADPIFILGLPRSGSTLVEQILASHSLVEGCGELVALPAIVRQLEGSHADEPEQADDDAEALFRSRPISSLGEEYLERTRFFRRLARPYFTDKMPSNFHHLGVICTVLPNAKIIDVRRHPLDCCLSNFKQIFPNRHDPSYALADMGLYYRGYVELLAHFDRILPGRIHRVIYEDLVRDPEHEIGRLLTYCALPFEEACLRHYETERGILTISSEQVRQPVYKDSVAQWRHYEEWIGPLKDALGPVLSAYPAVPDIFQDHP
jgi:tetratricopeptide (TPR) repeat protein